MRDEEKTVALFHPSALIPHPFFYPGGQVKERPPSRCTCR